MQLKVLAAEKEAAIKAQRDADDIEIMLSQVDSGILKPSPKTSLIHSRKNSVKSIPDVTLDSPRVSVGNLTPRERTDYGLSMESISMLVTGSNFNVPNFLGLKTPKFFYITTDISNIVYGSSNGNHQTVIPFSKFERLVPLHFF